YEMLNYYNFLANSSFLIHRSIIEDVGFYDPHIAASRLYDWDHTRRVFRNYRIVRVPVRIGLEYGPSRADSIGNTYPLFLEAPQEHFSSPRDHALLPHNYPDYDIWRMPENASAFLAAHIVEMRRFFASKPWAKGLPLTDERNIGVLLKPQRRVVGVYGYN